MHPLDVTGIEVVVAIAGVIGSWAVLRATVSDLKKDVGALRDLVILVRTMEASQKAADSELDRVRSRGHSNANRIQHLGERVAQCEMALEIRRGNGHDLTPPPQDPEDR